MREYIVNLTNDLIGKHGLDLVFETMKERAGKAKADAWKEEFVNLVRAQISSRSIREMSPETLGKVVCSLEEDELPCYNPGLFFGKPDQYLRDIVSSFLAWSIRYRLDEEARKRHGKIPAYQGRKRTEADVNPLSGHFGP